jgi:hypothetical protein
MAEELTRPALVVASQIPILGEYAGAVDNPVAPL